jgi:TP901 family phage tail tape measure protein
MREYFRYAGGSTKTFGRLFKQEFDTIGKVAQERVKTMQTQYIKMGRDASGAMRAMSIRPTTLDMNDYATKTALAAQRQALLNQLLKQGSTNLLNFGKNTQWAGRQLMVGFTVPLAYFGTMAAKTFIDLEKQAVRFKRVYGDALTTTDETNKALEDIQRLAEGFTKYGIAVTDTMEMAANAAAMGKVGAELTAQVAQATRLAILGGVEQAQALETTISVTNAFGVATEDLANKIDFLNAVENQTVVSIEDLTIAIPKAGPVVKQLGGSVEDLAFFLTAMKEGGINASEGANALKSGLAALINPTGKAVEMLGKFGVNINAIVEGNMGNVRQTVIDFAQALDTLDPLNRARAIEQLFGKFQFSRLSTLFQNVTKDGTQASRVLDLTGASIEELAILSERELGVLEDAIGTDFKESIENLKLAIAPIGKEFLKAVTPIAKAIGGFLEKFNDLGDGTKKFIVVATTLVGVIGPVLLMTFGLLANGVANIIKLFITMRAGFLRVGANSNILAQQTSYLNTEQLQAASVAASLNQAHTKLTQSFTIETSAVKLLRQAYVEATIAAAAFARANPGMMMPGRGGARPKKLARGTAYVPGTGNKDTVPAVLTPGEAVIPRDVAQDPRFQPIIDAMVSGKLQGFSEGTKAVVAFGAHQPFTTAHEDIAIRGKALAAEDLSGKTQFIQYTSGGTTAKKGVVSLENRVQQIAAVTGLTPNVVNDPFKLMEDLKNKGVNDVKIILGDEYKDSGVYDEAAKKSGIKLQKIILPRIMDEKGVSATRLRDAVAAGDLETAEKLIAKGTPPELRKIIFDEIKQNYVPPKSKNTISGSDDYTHVGKSSRVDTQTYLKQTPGLTDYDRARIEYSEGIQKSMGKNPTVGKYSSLGFAFDKKLNINLAKSDGISIEEFEKEWTKKGPKKWDITEDRKVVNNLHGNDNQIIDDELLAKVKEKAAKNNQRVTDDLIRESFEELPSRAKKTSTYQAMNAALNLNSDYGITGIPGSPEEVKKTIEKAIKSGFISPAANPRADGANVVIIDGDALEYNGKPTPLGKDGKPQKLSTVLGNPGFEYPTGVHAIVKRKNSGGKVVTGSIQGYDPRFPDKPIHVSQGSSTTRGRVGKHPALKALALKTKKALTGKDKSQKVESSKKRLKASSLAIMKQVDADVRASSMAKVKPTDFGTQVSPTTGRSFGVEGIGGVYEKDGKKVFVKPMLDEKSARAELNANTIARNVHGLSTPKQVMKVMRDPNNQKRKIIVLESDFDPKLSERDIKKKFTKDEYFKQLVAANLRVDKDLKMGNLGGDSLTDPGASGVFDKASGKRNFVANLPSMEEMARINLSGVKGDAAARSPFWFGNATADIAKGMTAQQYNDMMIAEIDRRIPRLEKTLATLDLTPEERPYYQAMLDRLKKGRTANWKEIHKLHTSILIKPDEKIEDEKTGKTRKPRTTSKPSNVKPSSGDPADKRMADKPKKGKRIVNVLKRGPKGAILPSASSAPLSQADQIRQRAAFEGISPSTARRRLMTEGQLVEGRRVTSGELVDAINKQTVATSQATDVAGKTLPLTKEELKAKQREIRAQKSQKIGMVSGPLAGAAGIASMAPFMMGNNNLGMALIGVSALASIAPMLMNPMAIFVAGILASAALMYKFNKDIEKARKEGIALANAMSMSSDKIKSLSMLSQKPGASEIQAAKRKNALNPLGDEQRKFGQNVLQGEAGKQILTDVESLVKQNFSTSEIGNILGTNLSQAVLQGAITSEQASSIASALGEELGSYKIPISVSAKLDELLGPNGERLGKEPLKIALDIKKESMKNLNSQFDLAKNRRQQEVTAGGGAMLLAGGLAGAAALAATGVGAPIAGALSLGLIGKALWDQNKARAANEKLDSAALQLGIESIGQNQQLLDSINEYYDKKIKIAKTEKEINDLQKARKIDIDELNKANAKTLEDVVALTSQLSDESFKKIIDSSLKQKFKDSSAGTKLLAGIAEEDLLKVKDQNIQRTLLLGFASQDGLSPQGVIDIVSFIASSENAKNVIEVFIKQNGFAALETLQELFGRVGEDLEPRTQELIINYINNNATGLKEDIAGLSALTNFKKQYGISIDINTNGVEDLAKATTALALIKDQPETLTRQNVLDLAIKDPDNFGQFSKDFDALSQDKPQISKFLYVNYIIASNDPNVIAAAKKEKMSVPEYIAKGMDATLFNTSGAVDAGDPKTPPPRDTLYDDLTKKLKLFNKESVNAIGGAQELIKQLGKGKNIKGFDGTLNQLTKIGANESLLNFASGLDPARLNKFFNEITKRGKNGKKVLNDLGIALNKIFPTVAVGEYIAKQNSVIREEKVRLAALTKLQLKGVDAATALALTADATTAAKIAGDGLSKVDLTKMINKTKKATTATKELAKAIKAAQFQADEESEGAAEALTESFEYQFIEIERKARDAFKQINGMAPEAMELDITINQKSIDKLQQDIDVINSEISGYSRALDLIGRQEDSITKSYDEKIESLNKQKDSLQSIKEINQFMLSQQKKQLGLADALTSGDISAAAVLAQEMRAEASQNALDSMTGGFDNAISNLETQKQKELSSIVAVVNGQKLNREQLDAKILELSDQIYLIETTQIAPLQKQIDKKQEFLDELDFQIKKEQTSLEINEMTKDEWDFIQRYTDASNRHMNNMVIDIDKIATSSTTTAKAWESILASIKAASLIGFSTSGGGGSGKFVTEKNDLGLTEEEVEDLINYEDAFLRPGAGMGFAKGGLVPKYFAKGGLSKGTDTVPAMLTPGEFVMNRAAVDKFGPMLSAINDPSFKIPQSSSYSGASSSINSVVDNSSAMYNYNIGITVPKSNANPNDIANAVIGQIKYIDAQRIRGQK